MAPTVTGRQRLRPGAAVYRGNTMTFPTRSPALPEPLALRTADAASALGISERTLWSLTARGVVPHVKLGSVTLYPLAALRTWLASSATRAVIASAAADAAEGGGD
jgi:excisionase family DNA binding protein